MIIEKRKKNSYTGSVQLKFWKMHYTRINQQNPIFIILKQVVYTIFFSYDPPYSRENNIAISISFIDL